MLGGLQGGLCMQQAASPTGWALGIALGALLPDLSNAHASLRGLALESPPACCLGCTFNPLLPAATLHAPGVGEFLAALASGPLCYYLRGVGKLCMTSIPSMTRDTM